ncbi:hypothetical protein KAI19_00070 [bacterium]|nr:hypothetical protein [bacterium]
MRHRQEWKSTFITLASSVKSRRIHVDLFPALREYQIKDDELDSLNI